MKKTFLFCFLIFCCFIFAPLVLASDSDVVISEIMIGEDGASDNEYIKLFNDSDSDIVLDGFALKKKTQSGVESSLVSSAKFKGAIKARGSFVIANPNYENFGSDLIYSGLSYYISADNTIILYNADGDILDKVGYGKAGDFEGAPAIGIESGQMLARKIMNGMAGDTDNNQADFEIKTVQAEQAQERETSTPIENNGPVIEVINQEANAVGIPNNKDLVISEIFPDPKGFDSDSEFIELYNGGAKEIDLSGWRLGDDSGYEYGLNGVIYPKSFLVIYRKESRIALNNNKDEVRLYQPEKSKASQTVKYENAKEGESLDSYKNKFVWNKLVTPGRENVINFSPIPDFYFPENTLPGAPVVFDSSDTFDDNKDNLEFSWDFGDGFKSNLENPEHTFWKDGNYKVRLTVGDGLEQAFVEKTIKIGNEKEDVKENKEKVVSRNKVVEKGQVKKNIVNISAGNDKFPEVFMIDLSHVKEIEAGDFAVTSGIVASEPGALGPQFFYIVDESGNGVQVYSNKKDFPELKIGDFIEVGGEISKINGVETRIKTRAHDDMEVIGSVGEPQPAEVLSDELEDMIGSLVKISGEIVKKNGQSVYVDDGAGEVLVYFQKEIDMKSLKAGDNLVVTGIVGSTKNGVRLLPRSDKDISKVANDEKEEARVQIAGGIDNDDNNSNNNGLQIPARDRKTEFWKYFLTIMAGGAVIGGILYFRFRN